MFSDRWSSGLEEVLMRGRRWMWACLRRRRGFTCPPPQDTPLLVGICDFGSSYSHICTFLYCYLREGAKFYLKDLVLIKGWKWTREVLAVSLIHNQILIAVNCNYLSGWTSCGRPNANDHRFLVLADHLHLRDGHLPLPLLRILLDRCAQEDAGWYRGGKQTGATFPRFSIGSRFFKDQKKWSTLLCFGKQTGVTFPRFSIGSSFEDL